MKIELKSVKTLQGREGYAYTANVYVDGKKSATAHDDGNGGGVHIMFDDDKLETLVRAWAKSLPQVKSIFTDKGEDVYYDNNLDMIVDNLFDGYLMKKEEAKMVRLSKKNLMWGDKVSSYNMVSWKGKTLKELCDITNGLIVVQKKFDEVKSELKDGEEILYPEYLTSLGIKL